ncbi:hypothetical protein Q5752_001827 [Cryptotrichosporon argae]
MVDVSVASDAAKAALRFRLATAADLDLLVRFRRECGWGEERVRANLGNPDYQMCIFIASIDGTDVEVGMGGWILEVPGWASKADGWVRLSALFISKKYQGLGYGGRALDLLERGAVDLFGARVFTLDTSAHDRVVSADGAEYDEDTSVESRNVGWYKRRGYEVYNGPEPRFQLPAQADKERKILAVDMKKPASAVAVTA